MSDLKEKVIEAGWAIRSHGQCVDREALIKATSHDDGDMLIRLWQEHCQHESAHFVQADLLKSDIEGALSNWADSFAKQQTKMYNQLELKLEAFREHSQDSSLQSEATIVALNSQLTDVLAELSTQKEATEAAQHQVLQQSAQITELTNEITVAQTSTQVGEDKQQQTVALIEDLEQQVKQLEQEKNDLQHVSQRELSELSADLQSKLSAQEDALTIKQDEFSAQEMLVAQLTSKLTTLADEKSQLESEYQQTLSGSEQEAQDKITQLNSDLKQAQTLLVSVQTEHKALQVKESELNMQLANLENDNKDASIAQQNLASQLADSEKNLAQSNTTYRAYQAKTETEQQRQLSHIAELETQIESKDTLLNQLTNQLQQLSADAKAQYETLQAQMQSEQAQAVESISVLTKQLETAEQSLKATTAQFDNDIAEQKKLAAENQELQQAMTDKEAQIASIQSELNATLDALGSQRKEYEQHEQQHQSQVVHLQSQVTELEKSNTTQIRDLTGKLTELEQQKLDISHTYEREVSALRTQLEQSDTAKREANELLAERERTLNTLDADLTEVKSAHHQALNQLKDKLAVSIQDSDRLETRIADLEAEKLRLEGLHEQKESRNLAEEETIRDTIKGLRDQVHQLESSYSELEHDSQQQLTEYRLKFDYAQKQLQKLTVES